MQHILLPFTISLLFFCSLSFGQNPEKQYKTFNEELVIPIQGDSIAVYALIAAGKENKETVFLLHGMPGNERNLDLGQDLRRTGRNVIFFSYRGSWGSQGEYLFSNALVDVKELISYFCQDINSLKFRVDTSKICLIGHSLGGNVALIAGAQNKRVKKIIALSSSNFGYESRDIHSIDSTLGFQKYLNASVMLNCNSKKFIQELLDHKKEFDILTYSNELRTKSVLLIDDFSRSDSWPGEMLEYIDYQVIESDHSFTDKREELIEFVMKWL